MKRSREMEKETRNVGEDKGLNKMDLAGKISCFVLSRRTGRDSVQ